MASARALFALAGSPLAERGPNTKAAPRVVTAPRVVAAPRVVTAPTARVRSIATRLAAMRRALTIAPEELKRQGVTRLTAIACRLLPSRRPKPLRGRPRTQQVRCLAAVWQRIDERDCRFTKRRGAGSRLSCAATICRRCRKYRLHAIATQHADGKWSYEGYLESGLPPHGCGFGCDGY